MLRPFQAEPAAIQFYTRFTAASGGELSPLLLRTAMGPEAYDFPLRPTTAVLDVAALTSDDIGNDISTAASITVDGEHVVSTLNTVGDQDFFRVELVGGQTYDFGMLAKAAGPAGVPVADSYLEIYGADGQLLGLSDGGANTTLNSVNSGFDAVLSFTAPADGAYFINARAFDQDGTNGGQGDFVGDYELYAQTVDERFAYKPLYTIDSPLHSIDWGSQLDRTSRNPDGDNGPRDNRATFTGTASNNAYGIEGKNVITYYFARQGDVFVDENPATVGSTDTMLQARNMEDWEKAAFRTALDQYEHVADVRYIEVQSRAEADLKFVTYQGTPGVGASLLGRMSPPNEENEGQAEFNAGDVRWTEAGLVQGGFYFPTLLHELGHGHGMAHPHDTGGRSSVMRGSDDGSVIGGGLGDYDLSQQIHTIMSYNDGWQTAPYGTPQSGGITGLEVDNFGWMGTLAPLDIAVIQDKYGVNEDYAKGDDTYVLKDLNQIGTFYSAIWDAGGVDTISYSGARNATIDLRAATLEYEAGGGGRVSYAYGVHGGFVIANGVTIENATSGSGADVLNGNEATNVLTANAGADVLSGFGGDDMLTGGKGNDTLTGGDGADQFWFGGLEGKDVITDFVHGQDHIGFGGSGPDSFADLRITAAARGGEDGVLITWGLGTDEVWVKGSSTFTASDFLFV